MWERIKIELYNRVGWYLQQLVPLTHRTTYIEDGEKHFTVWKMWMGRCYNIDDYVIK